MVCWASGFCCGDVFQKQRFCRDSEDISPTLQCLSERVFLVTILLPPRISQEQGERKETKDSGGFETEHEGRSGSNFSQHAGMSDAELQEHLGECVDNKGRHLTDTVFRKWMLYLKCFESKIILVIYLRKKVVHFSFYFNLKIVRFFCRTLYNEVSDKHTTVLSLK